MSAEELAHPLPGLVPSQQGQQAWTVASISRDGTRMLLVDADGNEMSVAVAPDALPRRSEKKTVSETPSVRPRDIQARIRAGESPESVADSAGTTLERIMPFAAPVIAEREHVAERATKASVRRVATDSAARTLGDAIANQIADVSPGEPSAVDEIEWDAWRRPDGRWSVVAMYDLLSRSGAAEFTFDVPGNYVSLDNDDARWLVGDLPQVSEPEAPQGLSVVPDLPVRSPEPPAWTPPPTPAVAEPVAIEPVVVEEVQPEPVAEPLQVTQVAEEIASVIPGADRKPKRRTRASIPSWDEIMFGGDTHGESPKSD